MGKSKKRKITLTGDLSFQRLMKSNTLYILCDGKSRGVYYSY